MTRDAEQAAVSDQGGCGRIGASGCEMIDELKSICGAVGDDLSDLRALMDDAVENLTQTFETIAKAAREQCSAGSLVTDHLVSELESHAERAVLHLQFHDVAAQMVDNLEKRARALEAGTGYLLAGDLQGAATTFGLVSKIRERHPRGKQASTAGDIELYE